MSQRQIIIARVYTLEGHEHLTRTLDILQQEKVAGVTVIRGIEGIGEAGELHTSSLLTLSLELPVIIEFYDESVKIDEIITLLKNKLDLRHIVSWPVTAHI